MISRSDKLSEDRNVTDHKSKRESAEFFVIQILAFLYVMFSKY